MRDGTPEDMTASARLEDYGIREGDVLVLIVGEPRWTADAAPGRPGRSPR